MSLAVTKDLTIFEHNGQDFYFQDICESLRSAGIESGGTVFVHSDLKSFGKVRPPITKATFVEAFVKAFEKVLGTRGNLIMPAFSYSFCKREVFDPEKTRSTVGLMTEHFRKHDGVKRSLDPIFSVVAMGPDQEYWTSVGRDCFGETSIFGKLHARNATLVFLGNTFDITYMHYVEQSFGVPYRYMKKFSGEVKADGKLRECDVDYLVRRLDVKVEYDLPKIEGYMREDGVLRKANLGHSRIQTVSAVDAFEVITRRLRKNVFSLLKGKPTA